MRFTILSLCIVIIVSCSEEKSSLGPTQPFILSGNYSGEATYWQFTGTDSAKTGTDSLIFSFSPDSTYFFEFNAPHYCGGYGGGHYFLNGDKMTIKNESYYLMHCIIQLNEIVQGEFTFSRRGKRIELYQEIPEFQFSRRVVLVRN